MAFVHSPYNQAKARQRGIINNNNYIKNGELNPDLIKKIEKNQYIDTDEAKKSIDKITTSDISDELKNYRIARAFEHNIKMKILNELLEDFGNILVIYKSSTAKKPRSSHVQYYGKQMRLKKLIEIQKDYGCKCRFILKEDLLNTQADVTKNTIKLGYTEIDREAGLLTSSQFLTNKGLQKYKEAEKIGGGSLKSQKKRAFDEVFFSNNKFAKVVPMNIATSYIVVTVILLINGEEKREEIKINNEQLYITDNGYYIKYKNIDTIVDRMEKKHRLNKIEVINIGGVTL